MFYFSFPVALSQAHAAYPCRLGHYVPKLSFKIDGAIKIIHYKQKLKQYMTTKPTLQKILQGILHTDMKANKTTESMGSIKPQE
jgi:hypothetical protein